ncbi:hypothetical protein MKW92_006344 [Papaver armeniacum]|nr:hypothetical protein MKW92_006344 [Papaver armeniacum]
MLNMSRPSRVIFPQMLVFQFLDASVLENSVSVRKRLLQRKEDTYCNVLASSTTNFTCVFMAGVGDFRLASVTSLVDPFPLASEMEDEENLVDITHMDMGSFRTGTYLRLEVHDVPYRMVENLNPCHPILVGGISLEEEHVGHTQVRLKQHSWHMKLLKSSDSVTVSAGWRRYQTKPIYAREIDNGWHQMLKFTPEHNHCLAIFWGPLAPPLTRIAVVQSNKGAFWIAAEAVVLDPKPDRKIMKESRQKGTPLKITKRKALIKFELEDINIAEFIGAPIRTLDGIRGQVKEVAKREGIAKCTFKKRICMSDVFMRMLRQAEAPRFFNSLSVPPEPREEQRRGVEIMDGDARPRIATTISLVRNKVGTYVAADGGAFDSLTNECIDENRDKILKFVTIFLLLQVDVKIGISPSSSIVDLLGKS